MVKISNIVVLYLILSISLNAQYENLRFDAIPSIPSVISIIQDSNGQIWLGTTMEGLFKYDGYEFTSYQNFPEDSTSLSSNYIDVIYEDRAGNLWVGTHNAGLCRFNKYTKQFTYK